MAVPFHTTRRVQFRDTDAAGIMHFSVFFTCMEETEHELLRDLGLSVVMRDEHGSTSWPRVSAHCDFSESVRFEDVLHVEAWVKRLGKKSVTYAFRFTCQGRDVATGSMTSVCCRMEKGTAPQPIPIPDWIADRLAQRSLSQTPPA